MRVTPYARHHFDGTRVDAPTEEVRHAADGRTYTVRSVILGGALTRLPVPKPRCAELAALIEQVERMPAPDGFRRIAHLLVDAGARDFTCVDPDDADIIKTPPAIRFTVSTLKFTGQVTVLYARGADLYAVELHRDGELVDRADEVYIDDLGHILEQLLDDGAGARSESKRSRVAGPGSRHPRSDRLITPSRNDQRISRRREPIGARCPAALRSHVFFLRYRSHHRSVRPWRSYAHMAQSLSVSSGQAQDQP